MCLAFFAVAAGTSLPLPTFVCMQLRLQKGFEGFDGPNPPLLFKILIFVPSIVTFLQFWTGMSG